MDSDGGPHLCSQRKQNKTQLMIISPEGLNGRLRTASWDECARKDGCYDQYFTKCYTCFGKRN